MVTGKTSAETRALREILTDCIEAAKKLGARLELELTEAVDMESESTNAIVRFVADESAGNPLNMRLLLDQLEERTVVAAIDLFSPPHPRLVIHGALKNRSYRIKIGLDNSDYST